jgi:hypothetical protein
MNISLGEIKMDFAYFGKKKYNNDGSHTYCKIGINKNLIQHMFLNKKEQYEGERIDYK